MFVRKVVRESAFRLARHDLAMFLADHEEALLVAFREELQRLDDEIPEENLFIDIKMVPLGEMMLKATLRAMRRFLTGDVSAPAEIETTAPPEQIEQTMTTVTSKGTIIRDG